MRNATLARPASKTYLRPHAAAAVDLLPAAAAAVAPKPVAVKTGLQRTVNAALHAQIMRNANLVRPASKTYLRPLAAAAVDLLPAAPKPVAVKTGLQRTVNAALHAPIMRNANLARPASKTYLRPLAAAAA